MSGPFYFKLYIATFVVFLIIDMIWLVFVARGFYQKYIGFLLAPNPNWIAAILFYLLFVVGIIVFAVVPGLQSNSLAKTAYLAALFGLLTYATYDLTNLATVKDWPLIVTVVDMIWGVVLSTSVSSISFYIGRLLK